MRSVGALLILILAGALIGLAGLWLMRQNETPMTTSNASLANVPTNANASSNVNPSAPVNVNAVQPEAPTLVPPIAEFSERTTKKSFGTYITPATSPVQPERFSGYHAGVDVEYTDKPSEEIPVNAIADGEVLLARRADGYGGVVAIRHQVNSQVVVAVYGHLQVSSLPEVGAQVVTGQTFARLGEGGSDDTDGERKHLHFALVRGDQVNLRGYASSEAGLSAWIDPRLVFSGMGDSA
jgi:hypothetical protein